MVIGVARPPTAAEAAVAAEKAVAAGVRMASAEGGGVALCSKSPCPCCSSWRRCVLRDVRRTSGGGWEGGGVFWARAAGVGVGRFGRFAPFVLGRCLHSPLGRRGGARVGRTNG
eukprot:TRINITY_DN3747_c0_g1_i2.p4 TRINITY_DN3747_c0_g1~~TRINITY_DN3747_c0_g1_i2.p4  ORF type:complete len:114 (+),score=24.96 TRINITY_DN3747_c0_g1_i2:245-586(+)